MVFITHSIDEAIVLGDRIAVMSARPGRIKEVLDVPFGWPRDADAGARRSALCRIARPHLAPAATARPKHAAAPREVEREHDRACERWPAGTGGRREPDRRQDAGRAGGAGRRRRRQWQIIGIRLASLAVVLSIWQVFGAHVDPVLFTTPSKIAAGRRHHDRQRRIVDLSVAEPGRARHRASRSPPCSASRSACCSRASGSSTWRSASTSPSCTRFPRSRWCRSSCCGPASRRPPRSSSCSCSPSSRWSSTPIRA